MNALLLLIGCVIGALLVHALHVTSRSTIDVPCIPHVILDDSAYGWDESTCVIWFAHGLFHRQYEGEKHPRMFTTAEDVTPDLTDAPHRMAIRCLQSPSLAMTKQERDLIEGLSA